LTRTSFQPLAKNVCAHPTPGGVHGLGQDAALCDAFIAAWCSKPLRQMNRVSCCSSGTRTTARVPPNRLFANPNFGRIFRAKNPREMQFGLRLSF
jgi:hypothetical protein